MRTIKPEKLHKGDTIGFLAVSGRIKDYECIETSKKYFEAKGYKVVVSDTCRSSHRYMAGNDDKACINALNEFFENKKINAILCARGGYGTLRLINDIDWDIIKNNPKIFAGYSDITILLSMIYKKTGLITFHSAMPNGDFSKTVQAYTEKSFFKTLEGNADKFESEQNRVYKSGRAEGRLWGGNLASLVSLCGTDFIPDDDLILFLEDLNEPVYKIDRMLTQLFNIEKIRKNVKGIAFGEFLNQEEPEMLEDVLKESVLKFDIPASGGFRITHGKIKDTIPYGVKAGFDADCGTITIEESCTN